MRVVGQVADLVDGEQTRAGCRRGGGVRAPRAVSWLLRSRSRSEAVMKSAEWPARTAWWTRFLVSIVLPRPWLPTRTTFSPLATKSRVKTRSTRRAMELLGPVPFEVGHRLEAAEARGAQAAFEAAAGAVLEFRRGRGVSSRTTGLQRFCVARAIRSLRSSAVWWSPSRCRLAVSVGSSSESAEGIVGLQARRGEIEIADARAVGQDDRRHRRLGPRCRRGCPGCAR